MEFRVSKRTLVPGLAALLVACGDRGITAPPAPPADASAVTIAILGLPAGIVAPVVVSGGGTSYTLTASATIHLAAGTYTLSAPNAQSGSATWYSSAVSRSITIAKGASNSFKVRYGSLPVAGAFVPQLELFDSAMVAFMTARHIGAGTLTISRYGEMLYSRAYGWRDSARTQPLSPNAMMRLASNSKPVTAAAIRRLVSDNLLTLDTKAFPFLGLTPAGAVADSRIDDVTVQQLLDHTGGWNRTIAGDIMFKSRDISRALGISTPPTKAQIAEWAMTQPLQHAPGTTAAYSNFGYLVLGLIVEKVSGQRYVEFVRQNIFTTTAASEVIEGRSRALDRDPREPFYSDPYTGCSVFNVDVCVQVPWPNGGWYLEAFDSCGGLVASGPALASFLESYWINGSLRVLGSAGSFTFYGSLDGTFTMARQRGDAANIVALFNQRTDPSGLAYEDIRGVVDAVSLQIRWPSPANAIAAR